MEPRTESEMASSLANQLYVAAPAFVRLQQRLRPRVCPFEELVPEIRNNGGRLLDFGCGAGLFTMHCVAQGYVESADGVDVNSSTIRIADEARRSSPDSGRVQFHSGAIPEGTYDAISMIDVMHHLQPSEQRSMFYDLCDRLAIGGVLVYKDMCRQPRWQAVANRMHDLVLSRQWIHYLPIEKAIGWAVEDLGLELLRRTRFDYLVYGHELAVFHKTG
ncbi:MAG: class I SAM-dependent methyltransferase [Actinomycetota bacterium]|nr:class I SAM-dependent methyltransferase [Actinomycetota bacterium]